jgi:hypothetical protein
MAALAAIGVTQTLAATNIVRVQGVVTAVTDTSITLTEAGGKVDKIDLVPTWAVSVSKSIAVDQIAPGSYIGTTNYAKPDGTGRSVEVHVSPAGVQGPGADFVMDANAGTTMTNGVVSTVVKSEGGRMLAVNYGTGVRSITVPPGIPIILNTPGVHAMVKVGQPVRVSTFATPTGGVRQFVAIGENGSPPP